MNPNESELLKESRRLEEFQKRLERHLGRADRRRLQQSRLMYRLRGAVLVVGYVLLAAAAVSAIYHLGT